MVVKNCPKGAKAPFMIMANGLYFDYADYKFKKKWN